MRFGRLSIGCLLVIGPAFAQQYVISTYAGGVPPPTPVQGMDLSIGQPMGVATDGAGNVYFVSAQLNSVLRLDESGVLTRIAGRHRPGYSGDGGPATSARLRLDISFGASSAPGLAFDSAGNLFIADSGNDCIRRVSPDGIITTVAGNGTQGFSGDGGPATSAQMNRPAGVALDGAGNLFIADLENNRIRRVSRSGIITTVAGTGPRGLSGDGGLAVSAQLSWVSGVAVDGAGNLFIVDRGNERVRQASPSGIITTVAGGATLSAPDGEPATSGRLGPWSVAVDSAGNLFIADGVFNRIRKVSPSGIQTTVAGNGACCGFSADGVPATSAQLFDPHGVAVDGAGNLFIADTGNNRIRKVSASGMITTVAGNGSCCQSGAFSGDGGPVAGAQLNSPYGVVVDGADNLFIADSANNRIRKVSPDGIITTLAGNGTWGFSGDGRPATSAQLNYPAGMAVDLGGDLFIVDRGNYRIRKVSSSGIITTVAGNGTWGFSGDGGPATRAQLSNTFGVAVDGAGNVFLTDGDRVRKISPDGIIATVAGGGQDVPGEGVLATSANLGEPAGVAVDKEGNLFIAGDRGILKVFPGGMITTVAGNGVCCFRGASGDGGPATSGRLSYPASVAVDADGNLFIADPGWRFFSGSDFVDDTAHRIRRVSASGIITTVAGTGAGGFSGDGGPAITAQLDAPAGVAVDSAGNLYVADALNNAVRVLRPTNYSVLIGAVVDAASQRANALSPGKLVVISGAGLGPSEQIQNWPGNSQFGTELAGTTVSFDGIAAPVLSTSATRVETIVPYAITSTSARVTVAYQGQVSNALTLPVEASEPSLFTLNQTGAGQAEAINTIDGSPNTAANPVQIGGFLSLYATGEGQTAPSGVDGRLAGSPPARPVLPVSAVVGGIPATVQSAGGAAGRASGVMEVTVQIPIGVQPGGYVPVVLQVGDRFSSQAVWIAVRD